MNRLIIEVGVDQLRRYTKRCIQDVGVLKRRDLLYTTCNNQRSLSDGFYFNIDLVISKRIRMEILLLERI